MGITNIGIIGGCGSSGTTLLTHLLSRSKYICSGPEFNCFNHKELYNYSDLCANYRKMLLGKGEASGYFGTNWFLTEPDYYGINYDLVDGWVENSIDTSSFIEKINKHVVERLGATYFIEKTPSNVYCFKDIASTFPDVPIIHVIRDGRDVVTSLMKRGYNIFGAGSRWLYDTLSGLSIREHKNYLEVRYEDLVTNPEKTLRIIFDFLGIPFDKELIEGQDDAQTSGTFTNNWEEDNTAKIWNQRPSDPISTSSIGRYKRKIKSSDLSLLYKIELTDYAVNILQLDKNTSFADLLAKLNYEINVDFNANAYSNKLKKITLEIGDHYRRLATIPKIMDSGLPRRYTRIAKN